MPATRSENLEWLMSHRLRVLIVDDNQDMVGMLQAVLELQGYEVKGIYSALTIAADVVEFEPDVVVLDIAMPGRTGWAAAREIRSMPAVKRKVTLIALSGEYLNAPDKAMWKKSGFDHFVVKTSDPMLLVELISSCGGEPKT